MSKRGDKMQAEMQSVLRRHRVPMSVNRVVGHALSAPEGPAPTHLNMMRHNAAALAQALSSRGHRA